MILSICTLGKCLPVSRKWKRWHLNKCLLLRVPSVCEVLKGRQRDLAFFPVFEEFMAWIAVQDLETLTSKRSAELSVGNSGDLSTISGLGRLSQGDRSKSCSHTSVVTMKEDSLYQWLETMASLKERKAAWFLLWLLGAHSSGFSFLALCNLQHSVKCLSRKEAVCIYSS